MSKILVLYYSSYGHIETMAEAIAEGARSAGATVDIKRVPETVPEEIAKGAHFKLDQKAPVATVADLENYDAIIVGTGTRFGRMSSQMAAFLDGAGGLWAKGALKRQGRRGLYLDRVAAWRAGNDALLDHHQSAPLRHDDRRPALQLRRPDGRRRGQGRLAPTAPPRSPTAMVRASRAVSRLMRQNFRADMWRTSQRSFSAEFIRPARLEEEMANLAMNRDRQETPALSSLEWKVVSLAMREATCVEPEAISWLGRLFHRATGIEPKMPLADPRLETLRRFVVPGPPPCRRIRTAQAPGRVRL